MSAYGWRVTMLGFGVLVAVLVVPLALMFSDGGAGCGTRFEHGR